MRFVCLQCPKGLVMFITSLDFNIFPDLPRGLHKHYTTDLYLLTSELFCTHIFCT